MTWTTWPQQGGEKGLDRLSGYILQAECTGLLMEWMWLGGKRFVKNDAGIFGWRCCQQRWECRVSRLQ